MVLTGKNVASLNDLGADARGLREGDLLAQRYRVLHPVDHGWCAYDERLRRTVFVEPILGGGETPHQRVRSEAAFGAALLDAIICGDTAFAVRVAPAGIQ